MLKAGSVTINKHSEKVQQKEEQWVQQSNPHAVLAVVTTTPTGYTRIALPLIASHPG